MRIPRVIRRKSITNMRLGLGVGWPWQWFRLAVVGVCWRR
jgi:hypothetical protein